MLKTRLSAVLSFYCTTKQISFVIWPHRDLILPLFGWLCAINYPVEW